MLPTIMTLPASLNGGGPFQSSTSEKMKRETAGTRSQPTS
jgi:hypothetical protein